MNYKKHPTLPCYASEDGHVYVHQDFGAEEWVKLREHYDNHGGYWKVNLDGTSNPRTRHAVHRIVYEAFTGDMHKGRGYVIDHIDFDTYNNRPENLQQITVSENTARSRCNSAHYNNKTILYTSEGAESAWTDSIPKLAKHLDIDVRRIYECLDGSAQKYKNMTFRVMEEK